ncbi:LppU/SCO3897 family protein [Modestobacter versicolor]|uniref:LppU/SCO3897 family protein n=1 Tax=Modestobacter versicolor TaxID=429133 RepID=UPI0034DFAEFD
MSTPGSGGPQPPEQTPGQSGGAAGWGQQPPAGQPYPGQQPQQPWGTPGQQPPAEGYGQPAGQPYGAPQFGAQPDGGQPGGATPFGQPAEPAKPKRKWLPILGGVLALLVVLGALTTFLGAGDPEVGDCIQQTDASEFDVVDCDSEDAQYKIEGTDAEMTGDEFNAAEDASLCEDVPSTTFVLWSGTDESKDGNVYCASDV